MRKDPVLLIAFIVVISASAGYAVPFEGTERLQLAPHDNYYLGLGDTFLKSGIYWGDLTKTYFPNLLASGTIMGTNYDLYIYPYPSSDVEQYQLEYSNPGVNIYTPTYNFGRFPTTPSDSNYFYFTRVEFQSGLDAIAVGQKLTLFGNNYVVGNGTSATFAGTTSDKLVLYKYDVEKTITGGELQTVIVDGISYGVTLQGASDSTHAVVKVGSDQQSIAKGSAKRVGGLDILVEDIYYASSSDQTQNAAKLALGIEKTTFMTSAKVKLYDSEDTVDGTWIKFVTANGKLKTMYIYVGGRSSNEDYLAVGGYYLDPVWNSFYWYFPAALDPSGRVSANVYLVGNAGSTNQICTDSDGGKNYYVKGTVTDLTMGISMSDYCNGNTVAEYFCTSTGFSSEPYYCSNGCSNGACLQNTTNSSFCTDTDGGLNYYVSGKTTGIDRANDLTVTAYDYCDSSSVLRENSCDGSYVRETFFGCPSGCSNGACVQNASTCIPESNSPDTGLPDGSSVCCSGLKKIGSGHLGPTGQCGNLTGGYGYYGYCTKCGDGICKFPEDVCNCPADCNTTSCTDSDGGKNYYVKGTVSDYSTGTKIDWTDYCNDGYTEIYGKYNLIEFSCGPYGVDQSWYSCTGGCQNGACVQNTSKCVPEGGSLGAVVPGNNNICCSGLTQISSDDTSSNGICQRMVGSYGYCSKCGDGVCKSPENKCNCPADCHDPVGYSGASWSCYDGIGGGSAGSTCKYYASWREMAETSCAGRCNSDGSKCGVNTFNLGSQCQVSSGFVILGQNFDLKEGESVKVSDYKNMQVKLDSILRPGCSASGGSVEGLRCPAPSYYVTVSMPDTCTTTGNASCAATGTQLVFSNLNPMQSAFGTTITMNSGGTFLANFVVQLAVSTGKYVKLGENFLLKQGDSAKVTDYKNMKVEFKGIVQDKCSSSDTTSKCLGSEPKYMVEVSLPPECSGDVCGVQPGLTLYFSSVNQKQNAFGSTITMLEKTSTSATFVVQVEGSKRNETVKCVFQGSKTQQQCYSEKGSCAGTETCVVSVSGYMGENVMWKSTCGGYAYTIIDGKAKYAEFNCLNSTTCAKIGEMCGGFQGKQCCEGTCRLDGNYPDASGICVGRTPVCGNGICEAGEADVCTKCQVTNNSNDTCQSSCRIGTCPSDCQNQLTVSSVETNKKVYGIGETVEIKAMLYSGSTLPGDISAVVRLPDGNTKNIILTKDESSCVTATSVGGGSGVGVPVVEVHATTSTSTAHVAAVTTSTAHAVAKPTAPVRVTGNVVATATSVSSGGSGGSSRGPVACPAVCRALWEWKDGTCKYNSCGSGCGPDGVKTFSSESECNSKIVPPYIIQNYCTYLGKFYDTQKEGSYVITVRAGNSVNSAYFTVLDKETASKYVILEDIGSQKFVNVVYYDSSSGPSIPGIKLQGAYMATYSSENSMTVGMILLGKDRSQVGEILNYVQQQSGYKLDKIEIEGNTVYVFSQGSQKAYLWTKENLVIIFIADQGTVSYQQTNMVQSAAVSVTGKVITTGLPTATATHAETTSTNTVAVDPTISKPIQTPIIADMPSEILSAYLKKHPSDLGSIVPKGPSYDLKLKKGWNLFSVPLAGISGQTFTLYESDCNYKSPLWVYRNGKYERSQSISDYSAAWIRVGGDCTVTVKGTSSYDLSTYFSNIPQLQSGWNVIGAIPSEVKVSDIYGCTFTKGPYMYNPISNKWEKAEYFEPGKGYVVTTAEKCSMSMSSDDMPPPLPELMASAKI